MKNRRMNEFARISILALAITSSLAADETIHVCPLWEKGWPSGLNAVTPASRVRIPVAGRVDLDADFNYDGAIANDPSDSFDLEKVPPGLVIGPQKLAKFIFRMTPFNARTTYTPGSGISLDKFVGSFEIRAINLNSKTGAFTTPEAEYAEAGHLRVWSDERCTKLLLDSRDPQKGRMEWVLAAADAPASVYLECAVPGSATSAFLLLLDLNDSGSKAYAAKKADPKSSRDTCFLSCRKESPEIRENYESKRRPQASLGFGNYYGFSNDERDYKNVWVDRPAKLGN